MLTDEIRAALRAQADPARAAGQQRYMKSVLPYYGLTSPALRATLKPVLSRSRLASADGWRAAVVDLWDHATHREEWYAAIAVLRHGRYRAFALEPSPENIAMLRNLIVTGAWWDVVDEISARTVGELLRAQPALMTPLLRGWAEEEDLWLRRTAIICQRLFREATDRELLTHAIEHSISDGDFFARKAIGWALREYSKTDGPWVRTYIAANADRLSPLSVREGLKWLGRPSSAG
ncbi:DNA alkylation repair protein [Tessaracoccus sp. ZS01]|uniref:DNA alkylation repair protein n=1 Tax=Tessaracoccus sp. ZS01 TaxID=1906324 RepID=UPI00096C02BD|nr:DNA alkylation repair protein [Tessaracoccus sp. ZS01]MCG6566742.1 DNA alkylation repair protein [Tessaracoccus sp. ZS01]OMG57889.1 hypothetical protein BJN44_03750 [Tessaracoccus sp. ZS01]